MMKAFVDTNVLLDLVCQREGFKDYANDIFRMCLQGQVHLAISVLTLINTNYTAQRYGFKEKDICSILSNIMPYIEITEMDGTMFVSALNSGSDDLEDALQYFSAKAANCDCIITRDKNGYKDFPILVYMPQAFLENV